MLPSKGYFRSLICPFFESEGCDRPHCHFRHVKGKGAKRKQVDLESDLIAGPSSSTPNPVESPDQPKESEKDSSPSYRPTPISELRRRHIPVQYAPEKPEYSRKIPRLSDCITRTVPKPAETLPTSNGTLVIEKIPANISATYVPTKISTDEEPAQEPIVAETPTLETPSSPIMEKAVEESDRENKHKHKSRSSHRSHKGSSSSSSSSHKKSSTGEHVIKESDKDNQSRTSSRNSKSSSSRSSHHDQDKGRDRHKESHERSSHRESSRHRSSEHKSSSKSSSSKDEEKTSCSKSRRKKRKEKKEEIIVLEDSESSRDAEVSFGAEEDNNEVRSPSPTVESQDPAVDPIPKEKVRVARSSASSTPSSIPTALKPSPGSVMLERWALQRPGQGKIRISHVPNVSSLLEEKGNLLAKENEKKSPNQPGPSGSLWTPRSVGSSRVAHVPKTVSNSNPIIKPDPDVSIPFTTRQTLLKSLYDTLCQYVDPATASMKALEEELGVAKRVKTTKTYQNAIANSLLRIRKNQGVDKSDEKEHLSAHSKPDFTYGLSIYECFEKYIMSEDELRLNGFPFAIEGSPGYAAIGGLGLTLRNIKQPDNIYRRVCYNCKLTYEVDESGFPLSDFDCKYHPRKLFRRRDPTPRMVYGCCNQEEGSGPCYLGQYHVAETESKERLPGFRKTQPCSDPSQQPEAYAVDCEMVWTTRGLELGRVTVVDLNRNRIFDELVRPSFPVLEYNTRFSGLTEESLNGAKLTLPDVQKQLLSFIFDDTILIGHSLDSDLKALKIIHHTVIDTSVVFPHRYYPEMKKALRTLATEFLKKIIQSDEKGHDSMEDAVTCIELMLMKVKEDCKGRKPRICISSC